MTRSNAVVCSLIIAMMISVSAISGCKDNAAASSKNTFYYNESDGLNTLDPARIGARAPWWIGGQVFCGLVGLDSSLQPIPMIARSWSVSPDGLVWTFILRNDVWFGDDACFPNGKGRTVTAEDIRYSFERICNRKTASTGFWVFDTKVKGATEYYHDSTGTIGHVEGFQIVNDTTFTITLTRPFAPFLAMLSIPYCYIVPHEAVEKYGMDFLRHPVGAGPFRLVIWEPDQKLVLIKNPKYFEHDASGKQLPYLDSVVVSFVKDTKTEFRLFKDGSLDAITNVPSETSELVFTPDGKSLTDAYKGYGYHRTPAMTVEYYGCMLDNTTPGGKGSILATNAYLRRAINYAIDREKIAKYVLKGRVISATHGPIPPGTPGYSGVEGYTYNKDLAIKLLDSAGYPGGKGLPALTMQLSQNERTMSVAEAVQDQLKGIGITLNLVQTSFPQHREMILSGKLPFWRTSWIADYPDAENFIALFYSKYTAPNGPNTTHFNNARVDSLYRAALDPSLSVNDRSALYGQAERIILDEAPWVWLYYSIIQRITRPGISGYTVDPLDRLVLTRVRKN